MDELKQWMRDNNVHQINLLCGNQLVIHHEGVGGWGDTPQEAFDDAKRRKYRIAELLA